MADFDLSDPDVVELLEEIEKQTERDDKKKSKKDDGTRR